VAGGVPHVRRQTGAAPLPVLRTWVENALAGPNH